MTLIPREKRMMDRRDEKHFPSRWPLLAAFLFVTALFGFLSGTAADMRLPGGVQTAGKGTDAPYVAKREPLRVIVSADRKDGAGTYPAHGDGALLAGSPLLPARHASATMPEISRASGASAFRPGWLARAPPLNG